jgi:predicted  nucleic acid-binding Zn-ribbon protein
MSNSANNEYRIVSNAGAILLLVCSLVGIFIPLSSVLLADNTDVDRAKSIIAMIQQPNSPDRNRVDDLLATIPLHSPLRPVASQAASIVHIQQGQFADALKCLQSAPANTSSSVSLQLGEQRLRLWLLLEMESSEEFDAMLRNIVNLSISDTLENSEQESMIEWLGAVSGMLQTEDQPTAIVIARRNQLRTIGEALSMDSTGSRFQVGFDKSSQRGNAIKARIAEFQKVGLAEAAAMLSVLKTELSAHEKLLKSTHRSLSVKRQNVEQLETSIESLKGRLQDNERLIRTPSSPNPQMLDEYKSLSLEYKMLMPPRLPPTTYKRDPVTGQAVVTQRPSQCEIQMYMVEKARYQEQRNQLSIRMSEVMQMNKRRELHNEASALRKQQRELEKEIEWAKRVRSMVEEDVAEAERKRNILAERLLVSRFALADVSSQSSISKSYIRPSRFDLMDYKGEATRLTKALR